MAPQEAAAAAGGRRRPACRSYEQRGPCCLLEILVGPLASSPASASRWLSCPAAIYEQRDKALSICQSLETGLQRSYIYVSVF
jgi:hypothetical protein